MKVLFVSSGNTKFGISPIIKNQGLSISKQGVSVSYFNIKGKGLFGYLKNIFILGNYVRKEDINLIHAHYSLSAFVAAISSRKPVVASLMGSDVHKSVFMRKLIIFFTRYIWKITIVKSENMKEILGINSIVVIPNGVDLNVLKPIELSVAKKHTNFPENKKIVLFFANPERKEKNYTLAEKAIEILNDNGVSLQVVHGVDFHDVPFYLNASDVVLMTSISEGSPNVIKEAMACNTSIIATDVGDIKAIIGSTPGCYITSFDPVDVASKLKKALEFNGKTQGRDNILHLDSNIIADRIISIYESILSRMV